MSVSARRTRVLSVPCPTTPRPNWARIDVHKWIVAAASISRLSGSSMFRELGRTNSDSQDQSKCAQRVGDATAFGCVDRLLLAQFGRVVRRDDR
jgi:hypothetical protein